MPKTKTVRNNRFRITSQAMGFDSKVERVLRLYPAHGELRAVEPWTGGGFSGARLWRLSTSAGTLCLRRWPPGHPDQQRLEFIQAVLWHVDQEGFHCVPLPLETEHHHGYVFYEGHLWELTPWLPGEPDYRRQPGRAKLMAAMEALSQFHLAASSFPLPDPGPASSPGILERLARLNHLLSGQLDALRTATSNGGWPEMSARGRDLLRLFGSTAGGVTALLQDAARQQVALQPCIRDIWHAHVLFRGDIVSGIVDFGALRAENVAADVARLLGSLAGDNRDEWELGLAAYQRLRPLSEAEMRLVVAFDRSTVLMGGLQWVEWVCLEHRQFDDRPGVLGRVDEFIARLQHLSKNAGEIPLD
jgi:homoserine kinase type II